MDEQRARELLRAERARVQQLLSDADLAGRSDREAADAHDGASDAGELLTAETTDNALAANLRDRLAALERAEQRLAAGTFGRSIRSGRPIPDERLEADPAAELTVDEAEEADRFGL
jgi:RNA polymerase-binding transcription factor